MTIEDIIEKMTEAACELYSYGEFGTSKRLFQLIDEACENNEVPIPDEAVHLNIDLDEHFGYDVLSEIRISKLPK